MNKEPVAWMRPSEEGYDSAFRDHSTVKFCTGNDWDGWIPLYTHPVKELTDEEMKEIAMKHQGVWDEDTFLCVDYRSFATEILRKASEK